MSRDRVQPSQRVYAILRTKNSVVRRRIYGAMDPAWEDDLIEIVTGQRQAWEAEVRHTAARRHALGYGEGWFLKRDACGRWRMYDARYHPIPQYVTPDHRCKDWSAAHSLMEHLRDADHGKRLEPARKKPEPTVKMRDSLLKLDFTVPEADVARWLTRKGVSRA